MNRLSQEKSPYLQMHAHQPVDWYPWNAEAFRQARALNRPILLSVGYSSCHWCHVIAHESFEDAEIAQFLNAHYLSIKVDKEERPDVDAVYMDALMLATGSGGWPMTLLLTPEGQPFFAASYLPKFQLLRLLQQTAKAWQGNEKKLRETARKFTERLQKVTQAAFDLPPLEKETGLVLARRAKWALSKQYDEAWGGFGPAPKFPAGHRLLFLLAYHQATGDRDALHMAEGTLLAMARGGLYDHVGGGFCRYSVDERWLVPHFEKMLYDNALLLWAYAEAWRITKNPLYRRIAKCTADYVLREMTGPEGQFYCAQDADSQGGEGAYYLLEREEICSWLGREAGEGFCDTYRLSANGRFTGDRIPNRIGKTMTVESESAFDAARNQVYQRRKERMPLNRDDKVLTSWNGWMIAALCAASNALDAPEYLNAAQKAAAFLKTHLMDEEGALFLRWREGERKGNAMLADYAAFILALCMTYALDGDSQFLHLAQKLAQDMIGQFSDRENGGFYFYGNTSERLITRPKETWDGALPSGNSCAALALLLLSRLDPAWQAAAQKQLAFATGSAKTQPADHCFALLALLNAQNDLSA